MRVTSRTPHNLKRSHYTLYRAWSDTILLYVGLTMNPNNRFGQHTRMTNWWPWVTHLTVEHLADVTRIAAHDAERAAIRSEQPLFNTMENRCIIPRCLSTSTNQLLCEIHWAERGSDWYKHWSPEGLAAIRDGQA